MNAPTVGEALARGASRIASVLGLDEASARIEVQALMVHVLGVTRAQLAANLRAALDEGRAAKYQSLLERRLEGEPIAYIVGSREFFSLTFKITSAVLIPRPETELLVEEALLRIPQDRRCRVLDLGTGSGAIAITIARHRPLADVTAIDASLEALALAGENAAVLLAGADATPSPFQGEEPALSLPKGWDGGGDISAGGSRRTPIPALPLEGGGVSRRIRFIRSDWFSALRDEKFDVIVSNPPYVAADDPHLDQGDLRFEPREALVGGADGLECIRHIVATAPYHLVAGGWLLFEHGDDQAEACRDSLRKYGFGEVVSARDLAGIERVSGGRRPGSC